VVRKKRKKFSLLSRRPSSHFNSVLESKIRGGKDALWRSGPVVLVFFCYTKVLSRKEKKRSLVSLVFVFIPLFPFHFFSSFVFSQSPSYLSTLYATLIRKPHLCRKSLALPGRTHVTTEDAPPDDEEEGVDGFFASETAAATSALPIPLPRKSGCTTTSER